MTAQFEGQNQDEKVIFLFRRHPIVMRRGFYALLIPFLIASIPTLIWPERLENLYIAFGGLGLGMLLFFYHWMGWYFTIFIVTNQRFRQITQKGFFNRSVIDVGVSKIQNISYNIPGFTASILGFGNLVVQTYVGDMYLDRIHHPDRIYHTMQKTVQEFGDAGAMIGSYEEAIE